MILLSQHITSNLGFTNNHIVHFVSVQDEKYKKFNDEQKARQEEQLKLMIGETPEVRTYKLFFSILK